MLCPKTYRLILGLTLLAGAAVPAIAQTNGQPRTFTAVALRPH